MLKCFKMFEMFKNVEMLESLNVCRHFSLQNEVFYETLRKRTKTGRLYTKTLRLCKKSHASAKNPTPLQKIPRLCAKTLGCGRIPDTARDV